MANLNKAIALAKQIHKGHKDKYGADYILHPLRVMKKLTCENEKIVAILHDVIEDSELTPEDLLDHGFSEEIVNAVDYLSKREKEQYDEYIDRVKNNQLAVKVKLADLEDNMDINRIKNPNKKDLQRIEKYKRAKKELIKIGSCEK